MNWRTFSAFLAAVFLFIILIGLASVMRSRDSVTFFFTGDTQGYLVPCGCKVVPAGGLARRASALDTLRSVTSGEVVPVEVTHAFADRGPARGLLNEEMGRFMAREGYLVGLGSYDLGLGLDALRTAAPGVPLLLAGQKGMDGSVEYRLGGWGWGPVRGGGARLRLVVLAETAAEGAALPDPLAAFAQEKAAHPADAWVVVGQLSPNSVTRIFKSSPDVLAVVAQWEVNVTSKPQESAKRWLIYLGDRGRRAATLKVRWTGTRWAINPDIAYLGPETPSDPAVEGEVAAVLAKVEAVNRGALSRLGSPAVSGAAYMGASACLPCHAKAHALWAASPHARATRDLAIDHQEQNPDCLRCHATGLGRPGGFPQVSVDLSGVQCEACHGPGEGHPPRKMVSSPPSQAACGGCHGPRDSPQFDAEGYWGLVKH